MLSNVTYPITLLLLHLLVRHRHALPYALVRCLSLSYFQKMPSFAVYPPPPSRCITLCTLGFVRDARPCTFECACRLSTNFEEISPTGARFDIYYVKTADDLKYPQLLRENRVRKGGIKHGILRTVHLLGSAQTFSGTGGATTQFLPATVRILTFFSLLWILRRM